MNYLPGMIECGLVELLRQAQAHLEPENLDYLDAIEARPISEDSAEQLRLAIVSRHDPADIDGWCDEEIGRWPLSGSYVFTPDGWGSNFNEPNSQAKYLSFTIEFKLHFSEMGVTREPAKQAAEKIESRALQAIMRDTTFGVKSLTCGLKDDLGGIVIPYYRVVKRSRMIPSGSEDEPNFSGKIWLRYLAEYHQ